LIREVAYAGLPKRRRAVAHARYAAWLASSPGRSAERSEIIAEHYQAAMSGEGADLAWADEPAERAAIRQRAFEAQIAAGDDLRARSAVGRALELHEAALGLASGEEERARALEAIGDDHDALYHGDEAWRALDTALTIRRAQAKATEPIARLASKMGAMAASRWGTFRERPDPAVIEAVVDEGLAAAGGSEAHLAALLSYKGATGLRWLAKGGVDPLGIPIRIAHAERGLEFASRLGLTHEASNACMILVQLHSLTGDFGRALAVAERALPLDEQLVEMRVSSTGFESANVIAEVGGRFADALPRARRALERGRQLSAHHLMHGSYTTMNVLFHLGRWDELLPVLDEHLDALVAERGRGCPYVRGGPVLGALLLAHRGDAGRARILLEEHAGAGSELGGAPDAIAARAWVALGDVDAGRGLAERVLSSGRKITTEENAYEYVAWLEALSAAADLQSLADALPAIRRMAHALAILPPAIGRAEAMLAGADDPDGARDRLRSALAIYEAMGVVFEAARTRDQLAALVEPREAEALHARAVETYRELGIGPRDSPPAGVQ
jgi:tetratricopeptide (TPR) repeat protein